MATLRNRNGKWHVQARRSGHPPRSLSMERKVSSWTSADRASGAGAPVLILAASRATASRVHFQRYERGPNRNTGDSVARGLDGRERDWCDRFGPGHYRNSSSVTRTRRPLNPPAPARPS